MFRLHSASQSYKWTPSRHNSGDFVPYRTVIHSCSLTLLLNYLNGIDILAAIHAWGISLLWSREGKEEQCSKARTLSLHLGKVSKNKVTTVPAAFMFLFGSSFLRLAMDLVCLLGEQGEDLDAGRGFGFWGTDLQVPPPLALNLRLLSDRGSVNNWLLSSLLNAAVFIGLKKLAGKRCKGKRRTVWK